LLTTAQQVLCPSTSEAMIYASIIWLLLRRLTAEDSLHKSELKPGCGVDKSLIPEG
jgi:hypothetical protein